MKLIYLFIAGFINTVLFAQVPNANYLTALATADSLYLEKQYKAALGIYQQAGADYPNDVRWPHRYNTACFWALLGEKDSAFALLNTIADKDGYTAYGNTFIDKDLASLHSDVRWQSFIEKVRNNRNKKIAKPNYELINELDDIRAKDQALRRELQDVEDKYGWESKELKALWDTIANLDSLNFVKVSNMIDKYGWLGPNVVGAEGNSTLFLVIQHGEIEEQEKYLPIMREAVKNGNAQGWDLALLEDRVAIRHGKKQIYGSQITKYKEEPAFVAPLEDPDNVDKRRAAMNMPPLASYVSRWGIKWNVKQYKRKLPYYIKVQQKTLAQ